MSVVSLLNPEAVSPMCGRFRLFARGDALVERFGLAETPALPPRYNIAPTQTVAVIGAKADGRRGLSMMKWGFTPHWEKDPKAGFRPVNAKAERVATTPMFRDAFKRRRCIVPTTGFYEWRTVGKKKFPVHFAMRDGRPFGVAGLWDVWKGGGEPIYSCAIITTTPNDLTATVHDRMPVILSPDDYARWLDPAVQDAAELQPLLVPFLADAMEAHDANPAMNKAGYEGPDALAEPTELFTV